MNVVFSLFAGKAYAIFALCLVLLFLFKRRIKSGGERLRLPFPVAHGAVGGFATLNAAFFPAGDVLLLFVVVSLVLFFTRNWRDKAILIAAIIFLLQPVEWYHYLAALADSAHRLPDLKVGEMYAEVAEYTKSGDFWDFIGCNITLGQKASLLWAVNAGRFFPDGRAVPVRLFTSEENGFLCHPKRTFICG